MTKGAVLEMTKGTPFEMTTKETNYYKNMKHYSLPRLKIALILFAGLLILTETSCVEKPGCGSRRDHRVRKRRVHKFAPTMGYIRIQVTQQQNSFWA